MSSNSKSSPSQSSAIQKSRLEKLPIELLSKILQLLIISPPIPAYSIEEELESYKDAKFSTASLHPCLVVSWRLHKVAYPLLFRYIRPLICCKEVNRFFNHMAANPELGKQVRSIEMTINPRYGVCDIRLDDMRNSMPSLKHIRVTTYYNTEALFVYKLLETFSLESFDCSWRLKEEDLAHITRPNGRLESAKTLKSLVIREGYESMKCLRHILSKLPKLRFLDVSRSLITAKDLEFLHPDARLTHLKAMDCMSIEPSGMVELITTHPSINKSLVLLHCSFNWENATKEDHRRSLLTFLSSAPKTLRSLDAQLSEFTQDHVSYLQDLCLQLEELSIGQWQRHGRESGSLHLEAIEDLVLGLRYTCDEVEHGEFDCSAHEKYETIQEKLKTRLATMSIRGGIPHPKKSSLRFLDISELEYSEHVKMMTSVLLSEKSSPLRTIVLGQSMRMNNCFQKVYNGLGWRLSPVFGETGQMEMCIQRT